MSDLRSGEVLKQFRGDLTAAEEKFSSRVATMVATGEAARVAVEANEEAREETQGAEDELDSLRTRIIELMEAADQDVNNRYLVQHTMSVLGKSGAEIESYFDHIEKIETDEQPIIIIARDEEELGVSGLISVVYGRTPGSEEDISADSNRVRLDRNEEGAGSRDVIIPVRSARGFSFDGISCTKLFAQLQGHEFSQAILANNGHPFEDVNFAGSAKEVKDLLMSGNDSGSQAADGIATRILGLPSLVAYGEDAVLEVSERIRERSSLLKVLDRRGLEGIGIDLTGLVDMEIPQALKEGLSSSLTRSVSSLLQKVSEVGYIGGLESEELAFLGPLQRALGIDPNFIVTLASLNSGAIGRGITDNLGELAKMGASLEAHGLDMDEARIVRGAKNMQRSALVNELSGTSMLRFIKRQRLTQELCRLDIDR